MSGCSATPGGRLTWWTASDIRVKLCSDVVVRVDSGLTDIEANEEVEQVSIDSLS